MLRVEHLQQSTSGSAAFVSSRHAGTSSVPLTPSRAEINDKSTASTGTNSATATGDASLFTLTNIYTFGENGHRPKENYRINSFVEVFDPPSTDHVELERRSRETHSSSSITRQSQTTSSARYGPGSSDRSRERERDVYVCMLCFLLDLLTSLSKGLFQSKDALRFQNTHSPQLDKVHSLSLQNKSAVPHLWSVHPRPPLSPAPSPTGNGSYVNG